MKKNLLTVLILALLIVNIALTSVMMFSVMGTNKKTAELVNNIATVLNLELNIPGEEPKEEVSLADTEVYNLTGSMTIPLTPEVNADGEKGKQTYMIFNCSLSINKKHADYKAYGGENFAERESLVKDVITTVVSAHTESECRDNTEELKNEILKAIQDMFQSDFIYKIGMSEIKFG